MTRSSVAASVRRNKEKRPELYCPSDRCLWRTGGGWCPRHGGSARKIPTVNLFGEDGISIFVRPTEYSEYKYAVCAPDDPERIVRVVGHQMYAASVEDARSSIFRAWVELGCPLVGGAL